MWQKKAEELKFDDGLSWTEVARMMMPDFPGLTEQQVLERVRRRLRRSERYIGQKPQKKEKKEKPVVLENRIPEVIKSKWTGNKVLRFGLMGDTQLGSKYAQITHLHTLYDIYEREGIKTVYHTGDMFDGIKMRPGHEFELYEISADGQLSDGIKNYPKRNKIITHFISGNHDASLYKLAGYDICRALSDKRPDMNYIGRDCAVIHITPNCTLELWHPWDGTAYALSYKAQKKIEAMESDSKPNILAIGHYHKMEQLCYRNVHCFQTACFQGQTPFTRGKGISISMGGWIIEIEVDESGTIKDIGSRFIPFYKSIKDDYMNWR